VSAFLAQVYQSMGQAARADEQRHIAAAEMRRVGDRRSVAELLLSMSRGYAVSPVDARAWLFEASAMAGQVGWTEGVERARLALARLQ
jgi:hypothetical protein